MKFDVVCNQLKSFFNDAQGQPISSFNIRWKKNIYKIDHSTKNMEKKVPSIGWKGSKKKKRKVKKNLAMAIEKEMGKWVKKNPWWNFHIPDCPSTSFGKWKCPCGKHQYQFQIRWVYR